jgi:hypothetical protein
MAEPDVEGISAESIASFTANGMQWRGPLSFPVEAKLASSF